MRTISVQQMPNGFEVETPTFWYWMKAGMAFTLGAGAVSLFAAVLGWLMFFGAVGGFYAASHGFTR